MTTERIIICFNPDGTFRGASSTDFGGQPVEVAADQLPNIGIDVASLARVTELELQVAGIEEKDTQIATLTEQISDYESTKAELATARAEFAELAAYKAAMEERVTAVLQSGDPAQYEALATEFLTPAQELARQAKVAQLEALKAEAAALEAELAG